MIDKTKLQQLKSSIEGLDTLRTELNIRREEFEEKNKELIDKIKELNEEQFVIKLNLTEEGITEFKETNDKKLTGGLGIRVMKSLVYDPTNAFNWAKEHKMCLQLDKKSFEKIAKTEDMGFVKKEEKVSVTFPKEIKVE